MQQEFPETSQKHLQSNTSTNAPPSPHHGFHHHHQDSNSPHRVRSNGSSTGSVRSVVEDSRSESADHFDADTLNERLRGLNLRGRISAGRPAPGQRISDYENALTPPTPRQALGFRLIKRPDSRLDGVQLTDFPNGKQKNTHIP